MSKTNQIINQKRRLIPNTGLRKYLKIRDEFALRFILNLEAMFFKKAKKITNNKLTNYKLKN
jgi:hypothetical protein